MTSGVRTVVVKDHWQRQTDGTYVSSHPKYVGMRIEQVSKAVWLLHQPWMDPIKRGTLVEIKHYAYQEANWISPSVREFV